MRKMRNTKTVTISSVFPAQPEEIWLLLSRVETLHYIVFPYAIFFPVDGATNMEWRADETYRFHLRVFGIIPFGIHTIRFKTFDRANFTIQSVEENRFVPVWEHTITLELLTAASHNNSTKYTDTVELCARRLTGIVFLWCKAFYHHRQKKWIKLLSES
jgi:hypothetical protein